MRSRTLAECDTKNGLPALHGKNPYKISTSDTLLESDQDPGSERKRNRIPGAAPKTSEESPERSRVVRAVIRAAIDIIVWVLTLLAVVIRGTVTIGLALSLLGGVR
jgi:hypothetical protein